MPNVYALLVGINAYSTSPLSGCINDVKAVEAWLQNSFGDNSSPVQLRIKRITDEDIIQPTRQNIIDGFKFFVDAVEGDICLFYYSGHGSFTVAPEAFWTERDGLLESFVCIDSRLPGGSDLTNKEMGYLIAKTLESKKGVHFVAITDCCHSGTITKALVENRYTERTMGANFIPRDIENYLGYDDTINGEAAYKDEMVSGKRRVTVLQAPHIHLAASQENQTAKERMIEGKQHGAFTYALLKTLYSNKGLISYHKLMASATVQVANLVQQQQPVFNLNGGLEDETGKLYFLMNRKDAAVPGYKVYWSNDHGWCVAAGPIHGASVGDTIVIANIGETKIIAQPAPDFSTISSNTQFGDKESEYEGKLITGAGYKVKLAIDNNLSQALKDLLQTAYQKLRPGYLELSDNNDAHYYIRNNQRGVFMTLPADELPVFDYSTVNSAAEAESFLEKAGMVANWLHLLEVNNPESQLTDKDYRITITQVKEAGNYEPGSFTRVDDITKPIELYYQYDGAKWRKPAIQCTITNTSSRELWFSCLYMNVDYAISSGDLKEVQLAAGKSTTLNMINDKGVEVPVLTLEVSKELMKKGYYDITDYLKLFVSEERINTSLFSQNALKLADISDNITGKHIIKKGLATSDDDDKEPGDWKTETIRLHIVRPKDSEQLNGGSTNINGILIEAPGGFAAKVAITSSQQPGITSKSATYDPLQKLRALQPFALQSGTRYVGIMDMLELTEVQQADAVSADTPLTVQLPVTRGGESFSVIPLGFDNETGHYYPLGFVDENNKVHIQRLPGSTPESAAITSKSLGGSIKLYFRKVVSDWFGLPNPHPKLVEFRPPTKKQDDKKVEKTLSERVAESKTILLIVHGIIGDTKSITNTYNTVLNEQQTTMNATADLILTFDYENLKTSIKETAGLLEKELALIGLEAGHGKKLVIMAHSMGGLVSRWFIEKGGGADVVSGLVMFGTPNMGTPWADVRDMAQAIITYAVNGAAFLQPWLFVLSAIGKLANGTQVTLKEMDAKTGIYGELNDGKGETKVKYTIISGDTHTIVPDYEKTSSLLDRIFKKAKYTSYHVLDETLFKKPNDIAVSVESIQGIPGSEKWKVLPERYVVPCDHMNYFSTKEAIKHLLD